jgi:hypothetical protein
VAEGKENNIVGDLHDEGWGSSVGGGDLSPPERDETSSSAESTTNSGSSSSSGVGTATATTNNSSSSNSSTVPGVLRRVKKSNFKCHNNRVSIYGITL